MTEMPFDLLTRRASRTMSRRGTLLSLGAGLAAALPAFASMEAKKRGKKRKNRRKRKQNENVGAICPQRGCCSCTADFQSASKCTLIEAASVPELTAACQQFCAPDQLFQANFHIADRANFCASNGACTIVDCPIPA